MMVFVTLEMEHFVDFGLNVLSIFKEQHGETERDDDSPGF
jgi:hypothetical protein